MLRGLREQLAEDPELCRKLGEGASRSVRTEFEIERVVSALLSHMTGASGGSGDGRGPKAPSADHLNETDVA